VGEEVGVARWARIGLALLLAVGAAVVRPGPAVAQTFPVPTVAPNPVAFGTVTVGGTGTQVVTVRNDVPRSRITITALALPAAPFAVTGDTCSKQTLSTGASCTITIAFAPTAGQAYSGTLGISYGTPTTTFGQVPVGLTGTGFAPAPGLTLTPAVTDFGATTIGTPRELDLTLRNSGNLPLTPASPVTAITGSQAAEFAVVSPACGPLASGATCVVRVRFVPGADGVRTASITASYRVASAAAVVPISATARLTGTGAVAPVLALTITPGELVFPDTVVGTASPSQVLTVRNTGNQPNAIASVTPGGTHPAEFPVSGCAPGLSLAPNATCDLTVVFQPANVGPRSATVEVRGAGGSVASGAARGVGIRLGLAIEPPAADFGGAVVGVTLPAQTLLVRNTGTVPLTLAAPAIEGGPDFAVASTGCTSEPLAAGATCPVDVTATPTATGPRQGLLRATSGTVTATASLTVMGLYTPALRMVPAVSPAGTVTTAVGTGFPPNTVVPFGWDGGGPRQVTTDAAGAFSVPIVIMRHERLGPRAMVAPVQANLYFGVSAPHLTTAPTFRPSGSGLFSGRTTLVSRG
jgi:hypothetical protein